MMIFVIGSVGFIGVNFVFDWLVLYDELVVSFDKFIYVGNWQNFVSFDGDVWYIFVVGDIGDSQLVVCLFVEYQLWVIFNFVVEFYVDCLIYGFEDFIQINIVGIFCLLEEVCVYWGVLELEVKVVFCFFYVFIDEVYGLLVLSDLVFIENNCYELNSFYLVFKVVFDYLVWVYYYIYGLLVLIINCLNNYGFYYFLEKFILLVIYNVLVGKLMLIYGDGQQICDWFYVKDYCSVICWVFEVG